MSHSAPSRPELVPLGPSLRRGGGRHLYFRCTGPSMAPTLSPGDVIVVAPYGVRRVRRGDLIVFRLPDSGRLIVHRVASVGKSGLIVRGDNNSLPDPWSPETGDILGRVVGRVRNREVRGLAGGTAGDLSGRAFRLMSAARQALFRLIRPAYRWAADRGAARFLSSFLPKSRLIAVERPAGIELLLVAGGRVIARKPAGGGTWHVRQPFKLLVDIRALPAGPGNDALENREGKNRPAGNMI